jgi:hypothetical protein
MTQNRETLSSEFIFISPKPSPVSSENFLKTVALFQSRGKLSVLPETLTYYSKAKTGNFDYSTCHFPPHIYTGSNGHEKLRRLRDAHKEKMITPYYSQSFSPVAINPAANQAIFSTHYTCGTLCAGTHYIVMEIVNEKWVVRSNALTFVS